MGNMRKPDGLALAGIYEIQGGRTWICTHMEFCATGLYKAGFYEPATNQYNEASREELEKMFEKGAIALKSFTRGRVIM